MKTRSDIAREMLASGQKPSEVAAMLGVTRQFIYNIRSKDKKKAKRQQIKAEAAKQPEKPKRKVGRPKGSKDKQPRKVPNNKTDLQKLRKAVDGIMPPEVKKEVEPQSLVYIGNPTPNLWTRIKAVFTGRYE